MRIKIRPSHRHASIVAGKTRKPFCGVPLIPALSRAIFSGTETREAHLLAFRGSGGSHGRKHLPTVSWHSDDLQDGPGSPASLAPAAPPPASREPHRPAPADPGDRAQGRAA